MLSTIDQPQNKGHIQTQSEVLGKDISHKWKLKKKKAGVEIFISDKKDFKTKAVKRDEEGRYIMIKGSIQEEDITIINIYASNIGAPQYVRQMLTSMKVKINKYQTQRTNIKSSKGKTTNNTQGDSHKDNS